MEIRRKLNELRKKIAYRCQTIDSTLSIPLCILIRLVNRILLNVNPSIARNFAIFTII